MDNITAFYEIYANRFLAWVEWGDTKCPYCGGSGLVNSLEYDYDDCSECKGSGIAIQDYLHDANAMLRVLNNFDWWRIKLENKNYEVCLKINEHFYWGDGIDLHWAVLNALMLSPKYEEWLATL